MNVIKTPCGDIVGTSGRVPGTVAYKGIRYATADRWTYPKQVTSWEGIYDATQYGNCCYQPRSFYNEEDNLKKIFYYNEFRKGDEYTYSEDCLFLNIFVPESDQEVDRLPVLIYIHGGGFTGGCGHEQHFDGPVWPTKGVIGVTINYRLGPLGFLCLPELKAEAGFSGNYGLFDQLTAIRWVRDNIASFGGDPENITIMGQSAGAMSVQQLCLSPLTEGHFQRAVMSSGGGVSKLMPTGSIEKSEFFWKTAMERSGCKTLAEFRALPVEKLFAVWQETRKDTKGGNCFPVVDGRLVMKRGVRKNIPYMAGANSQDMMPPILLSMAKKWCSSQNKPSYTWLFERQLPGDNKGAWHSSDLWYWFGTLDNCWRPMEEVDRVLSDVMTTYLCNFARTGNPNHTGNLPMWSASDKSQPRVMRLDGASIRMGKPASAMLIYTMLTTKPVGE